MTSPVKRPPPQKQQSLDPTLYQVRIVVYGSRHYNNKKEFHEEVMNYIEQFEGTNILFISGAARTGADDLILRWCKFFNYPCLPCPADWNDPNHPKGYNPAAGFIRNDHMADLATHGLGFWDGISGGTKDMTERLSDREKSYRVVRVEVDKDARLQKKAIHRHSDDLRPPSGDLIEDIPRLRCVGDDETTVLHANP